MDHAERREPTPRELDLQRQVNDLRAALKRQRDDSERQLTDLRKRPEGLSQHIRDSEAACRRMKGEIASAGRELADANRRTAELTARIAAGAQRRDEMIQVLVVLVGAEDNESLSEEEYNRRIDACVRRARTLLSLEGVDAK